MPNRPRAQFRAASLVSDRTSSLVSSQEVVEQSFFAAPARHEFSRSGTNANYSLPIDWQGKEKRPPCESMGNVVLAMGNDLFLYQFVASTPSLNLINRSLSASRPAGVSGN